MPLTLGYYNREDIPFYYALADAFTICDQHFCSSLTGTTPNRLHLWTGTIRARQRADSPAHLLNSDAVYDSEVSWTTFPERLEDHGVSWKIYQNEIWVGVGLDEEAEPWLTNFGDNPIEYFTQFRIRFVESRRRYMDECARLLPAQIEELVRKAKESGTSTAEKAKLARLVKEKRKLLRQATEERKLYTQANFAQLSQRDKDLHAKAFCTNVGDPFYHQLTELTYQDGGEERRVKAPRGDLFHQLRQDVESGKLPMVSWVVAPQQFSDHPCSAWYGAWYIAELMDILTANPAVWKKTIFMLTYDENDGYFDHVVPFGAPHPGRPETGRVSADIDAGLEYVERDDELQRKPASEVRDNSIGLGYRVPLVIASPWSRGGCVCSQVFDHTSPLQFLERFLTHKTGREIKEPNINQWRRTVCGDLTSAFQPAAGYEVEPLPFPERDEFIAQIHRARFKDLPAGYHALTKAEIEQIRRDPSASPWLPHQEPGVRRASALPYQLAVEGGLSADRRRFVIRFAASAEIFGRQAAGSPFLVYARFGPHEVRTRDYAVAAGDRFEDSWPVADFADGRYHLCVYGPNGFYREFRGDADDPPVEIHLNYGRGSDPQRSLTGNVEIGAANRDQRRSYTVQIADLAYNSGAHERNLAPSARESSTVDTQQSFGWYDLGIKFVGHPSFEKRYAGHVETGTWSYSDPAMGRVVS
jgi:phospholipase C